MWSLPPPSPPLSSQHCWNAALIRPDETTVLVLTGAGRKPHGELASS